MEAIELKDEEGKQVVETVETKNDVSNSSTNQFTIEEERELVAILAYD